MAGSKSIRRRRQVRPGGSTHASPRNFPDSQKAAEKSHRKLGDQPELKDFYAIAFGRVLKELRTERDLTEAEAATRAKIRLPRWRRREQGLHTPHLSDLVLIAKAFQMRPALLMKRLTEYRDEEEQKAQ